MDTPKSKHIDFWLHYYLKLHKRATSPLMKRAALIRLRHYQSQAKALLKR